MYYVCHNISHMNSILYLLIGSSPINISFYQAKRLKWVDEGYELLVFTDECIISNGPMTMKLQRELLNADILVIVAVTNKESVEWINNNRKTIENVICLDSSPDLKNKLGGYDVPSEVRGSMFGNFFGNSQSEKAKESYEVVQTVSEAWDRHNSDDIRFCWGGPVNASPEIGVCGERTAGYSVWGKRYTSELSMLYTLCGSCKRVIRSIFSSTRNVNNAYVEATPMQPRLSGAP